MHGHGKSTTRSHARYVTARVTCVKWVDENCPPCPRVFSVLKVPDQLRIADERPRRRPSIRPSRIAVRGCLGIDSELPLTTFAANPAEPASRPRPLSRRARRRR
jgi:hypothetical protein